jgi:hypothetical protein
MMQRLLTGGVALALGLFPIAAVSQPEAGDPVFQTDFEEGGVLRVWGAEQNRHVRLATGCASANSLTVEAPPGVTSNATAYLPLPVEKLRGARLHCRAMVKAENVTQPPKPWNGVKFMLHLRGPGGQQWLQQNDVFGTFDWKRIQFNANVPDDVTHAELILGLEAVNGSVQFDDIKLSVLRGPRARPVSPLQGPVFTGREEPRLRGAMVHPDITPESLRVLGQEWKANLIRWQLIRYGAAARLKTFAEYDVWLEGELRKLEQALPHCEKHGLRVVLDLHSPPGGKPTVSGYAGSDGGLFTDRAAQDKFVEVWQRMARRFRDSAAIWGYDLANEPVEEELGEGCDDWQGLATRTARAVREIDPRHAIIVEPAPWGGPESLVNLEPLPVPGVVYSVHVYVPHQFTHQGVHDSSGGLKYPGEIAGQPWDKEQLRRVLQPVRDWQRDYGVHLYIGEFSAIRWAPDYSAYRYLKDCIELFEENGWDWTYHAFREGNGWSVEHGPDRKESSPSRTQTSREKLLRSWFELNAQSK